MKITVKIILTFTISWLCCLQNAIIHARELSVSPFMNGRTMDNNHNLDEDIPLTTDNRILTYIYNPNEVFLMVLHYGFQSHIEFAKNEEIQTLTLGDSYAWKISPLANRLFIRPLENNIRTNMTVITNKRAYQFDLVSKELDEDEEKDLVYLVRFHYPRKKAR